MMKVRELIKCLEVFDDEEDIKNTLLCTEEKTYHIIVKEHKDES
jgi:hypothetical protein